MTSRERFMAGGVLTLIVGVGGTFLFNVLFLQPLAARQRAIDEKRQDNEHKQDRIREVLARRAQLAAWREQSLPGDTDTENYSTTRRLYGDYLRKVMADCELAAPTMRITSAKPSDTRGGPKLAGKKPIYTKLTFNVEGARGNLASVVKMLETFYKTGMLHQIHKLRLARPRTLSGDQQPGDLDVTLTIEALVLHGVAPRDYLNYLDRRLVALDFVNAARGGPAGLGLALATLGPTGELGPAPLAPGRHYEDIAAKNVFYPTGETPDGEDTQVTQYVYLTDITHNDQAIRGHDRDEAWLFDRVNNHHSRLRVRRGFDQFTVMDDKGKVLVKASVLRLGERDVYFQASGKYYAMHVGQNLEEALRHPLPDYKVKELKIATTGR